MAITFNNLTNSKKIEEINASIENHEGRITTLESASGGGASGGSKLYRHKVMLAYERGDNSMTYNTIDILSTRSTPYSTSSNAEFLSDISKMYGDGVFYTSFIPFRTGENAGGFYAATFNYSYGFVTITAMAMTTENGTITSCNVVTTEVRQYNTTVVKSDTVKEL